MSNTGGPPASGLAKLTRAQVHTMDWPTEARTQPKPRPSPKRLRQVLPDSAAGHVATDEVMCRIATRLVGLADRRRRLQQEHERLEQEERRLLVAAGSRAMLLELQPPDSTQPME